MGLVKSFLLIIYTLSAVGVKIQLHYCCGHLADIHWGTAENHTQGCDGEGCCKADNGCCRYETISINNSADHCSPQPVCVDLPMKLEAQRKPLLALRSIQSDDLKINIKESPPPLKKKTYIVFCQRKNCDEMI